MRDFKNFYEFIYQLARKRRKIGRYQQHQYSDLVHSLTFTPCKVAKPQQGMELKEKDKYPWEKHIRES